MLQLLEVVHVCFYIPVMATGVTPDAKDSSQLTTEILRINNPAAALGTLEWVLTHR